MDRETETQGAAVVTLRRANGGTEYLVLHRSGVPDGSDWAWTPPSGCRRCGEAPKACAERELTEETGLRLACVPTSYGTPEWEVYLALAPPDAVICLSDEHDDMAWLSAEDAADRCLPDQVGNSIRRVAELVGVRALS